MAERERLDGRTTLREIFAANRATAEGELTDGEFRFWMMVRSMEGADRGCYADTEYLVAMLQKSESHVTKVRASLVRKGWLNVTQRGPKSPELRAVLPAAKGLHEDETLGLHKDETLPSAVKQGFHKGLHHSAIPPRPPNKESTGSTEKNTSDKESDEVSVFEYWATRRTAILPGSTRPPKRTPKRLSKVKARLSDGYTVMDLKLAVDGCLGSERNVEGGYVDLELICRDDQHVTQYMQWARKNGIGSGTHLMTAAQVAAWDAES